MKAIIVDDEKHCREVLEHLLNKYCSDINLLAVCAGAEEAIVSLQLHSPDILFLDIEMPGMNGFELLDKFPDPTFEIIFTTAYNEYAIKAIKHSALDYLLKPIDKDELIQSVKKVKANKANNIPARVNELLQLLNMKKESKRFAVPTLDGLIMIDAADIVFCESDSAYCKFYFTSGKQLVISKTLKEVEEVLQGNDFCRIHHSFLINMKLVQSYIRGEGGEVVLNNGQHLPVSRTRKQEFLSLLERI